MEEIGVRKFFSGQKIFITGGLGFMGKSLVEKILRDCPDVDKIYLLIRQKKKYTLQQRLERMFNDQLFDILKEKYPGVLEEKIVPIAGDIEELDLGLNEKDRQLLINEITLMYHVAASIRFDLPLNEAIIVNVRAVREICDLLLEMKQLQCFLHVSTAYAHTNHRVIEEKTYPPQTDWKKCIALAEKGEEGLNEITPIFAIGHPNTYTFTKALGERVVYDKLNGILPTIIYRPTIVTSTLSDPVTGWTDNFNGPSGLLTAGGTGLVRCFLFNESKSNNYLPVDKFSRSAIVAMWYKCCKMTDSEKNEISVYNAEGYYIKLREMAEISRNVVVWASPHPYTMLFPDCYLTSSKMLFYLFNLFVHLPIAMFFDLLLKLTTGRTAMVQKILQQFYVSMLKLNYFTLYDWDIRSTKLSMLQESLPRAERDDFNYDYDGVDKSDFVINLARGVVRYLFKMDPDDPDAKYKRRVLILYYLDRLLKAIVILVFLYLIFYKYDIINLLRIWIYNYFENL